MIFLDKALGLFYREHDSMAVKGKAHAGVFIGCLVLGLAGCKGSGNAESIEPRRPSGASRRATPAAPPVSTTEETETEELLAGPIGNPFLSPEERQVLALGPTRERLTSVHVAAIFYAPPLSKAIVAGRVMEEGDVIDQKQIVQIQQEAIVLRDVVDGRKEYVAELESMPGAGAPPPQD